MMLLDIIKEPMTFTQLFELKWFDDDVYKLFFRLGINLFFIIIVIRFLYYPKSKRKDFLFTYFII